MRMAIREDRGAMRQGEEHVDIDRRRLDELLDESRDLHADAMSRVRATFPALGQIGARRRGATVADGPFDGHDGLDTGRRRALVQLGLGARGLAAHSLAYGTIGSMVAGVLATPAAADRALDVQILQTASSLEQLAVNAYDTLLRTNPAGIGDLPGTAGQVVRTFVTTTATQHEEHKRAFQEQTRLLGGVEQTEPNPTFRLIVDAQVSRFRTPTDVLDLAALLEKVATDTYLVNLTQLEDAETKAVMASVMGVEAQHLASLRAVSALLKADAPQLVKIPVGTDLANLPRTLARAAFPDALHTVGSADLIAQPETGAVR